MVEVPVKTGLMNIGQEATPPAVVLPDPVAVFSGRSARITSLALGHVLEDYLNLIATIFRAQADIQAALPPVTLPESAMRTAHGMPLLQADQIEVDHTTELIFQRLVETLRSVVAPEAFKSALLRLSAMTPAERKNLLGATLRDEPAEDVALRVLATAALQVHVTRLAAKLDAANVEPVAHGVCPVCASLPVASAVVSWQAANNTRFCMCSLCSTQWHIVRQKCVTCGTTDGIRYPQIEGKPDHLRAETCDSCKSYVKIVYQTRDPACDPFADDLASLDLDMVLKAEGWKRGARNPFLLGY